MVFKRLLVLCLLLLLLLSLPGVVSALPAPPPEQCTPQTDVGIESLQYLMDWGCSIISSGSSNTIAISGYTKAYQPVDYIMVRIYLQQWNGSSWVDLGSWPFEKYESSSVSGSKGFEVARGFYYRAKGVHNVTENGIKEPATSYSSAISIN